MPANLVTGLEKVSFHSSLKERQCQRMLKLPYNCTNFTCQQSNAQYFSRQALIDLETRTSRSTSWKGRGTRYQIANINWIIEKPKGFFKKKIYLSEFASAFDSVDQKKLWKILKEMGLSDHLTHLLRNLYVGQDATERNRHGTMDQFKIEKGVLQSCILTPCLFNLYAECIMQNAGCFTGWNQDCQKKYQLQICR